MEKSKILVTGATGATGGSAVSALRASGHEVRAFAHEDDAGAEALRASGVEVVIGDFLAIDSLRSALEGVRAAYYVYPLSPQILAGNRQLCPSSKGGRSECDRELVANDGAP